MNSYFFEIVERAFDRFSWILVVYRKGRRRVIARASRDYRTPRKAARAARRLKRIVGDAPIVFAVAPAPDFTFEVLRDVLPLPVGSPESAEDFRGQPRTSAFALRPAAVARAATPAPAPATAETSQQKQATRAAEDQPAAPVRDDQPPAPATEGQQAAPATADQPTAAATDDQPVRPARTRKQAAAPAPRGRRPAKATARS